jgi:hypothetical protein
MGSDELLLYRIGVRELTTLAHFGLELYTHIGLLLPLELQGGRVYNPQDSGYTNPRLELLQEVKIALKRAASQWSSSGQLFY